RASAPITAKSQERRADQANQEQDQKCCHSPAYQSEEAKPGRDCNCAEITGSRARTPPSPHILPIHEVCFSLTMEGSFGWRAGAPFFFWGRLWVRSTCVRHWRPTSWMPLFESNRMTEPNSSPVPNLNEGLRCWLRNV